MKNTPSQVHKAILRKEYIGRINRVIDFIDENLDISLDLDTLARVANFSRFHFHRLFSALVGETLNSFIKRLRLEKAASMLIKNLSYTITDIAFKVGFNSSAAFSRAFRDYFKISPSQFRNGGYKKIIKKLKLFYKNDNSNSKDSKVLSKDSKTYSNNSQEWNTSSYYIDDRTFRSKRRLAMKVEVKDMPEMHVAYFRHIGSYHGVGKAFENLFRWAGARGLIKFPETKILALYHDDPEVTEEGKLRSSACITVSEETEVSGEIGKTTVSGGKYACARFEIKEDEFQEAWNSVMRDWMPESGYQPDDRPCYELYHSDPKKHPEGKMILDICVPVKPL